MGHEVSYVLNFEEGKKRILEKDFVIYFVDLILPGGSGIDLVKLIHDKNNDSIIIIITGYPNVPTLVEAVNQEVYDYINKPFTRKKIIDLVNHVLEDPRKIKR